MGQYFKHNLRVTAIIIGVLITPAAAPRTAAAKAVTLTVENHSSTALSLYDDTSAEWVSQGFGLNGDAPKSAETAQFTLEDTHKYRIVQQGREPEGGHAFVWFNDALTHDGIAIPNRYFEIDPSRNAVVVRGVEVRFRLVTPAPQQPAYEYVYLNQGGTNGKGFTRLGYRDAVVYLPPFTKSLAGFDGVYANINFPMSKSSLGRLALGPNFDIIGWRGVGHRVVRTGPRSIRVTTNTHEVMDITVGPAFLEAEDMVSEDNTWGTVEHFEGWYSGAPSRGGWLWGNYFMTDGEPGQGEASGTVRISQSGTHRLWVRYHHFTAYQGPFKVSVYQNGNLMGSKDFDVAPDPSVVMNQPIWRYLDVPLSFGDAEIVLSKVSPELEVTWLSRFIDCFAVTQDLSYVPDIMHFADPLYLQVEMGPTENLPAVIHMFGRYPRAIPSENGDAAYFIPHANIWESGLYLGGIYTGYASNPTNPDFLTADEITPWINITPYLYYMGSNHLQLYAIQEYTVNAETSDYVVRLSKTPNAAGIFKTFSRSGVGAGLLVDIDLLNDDNTLSDLDYSRVAYDAASSLPPTVGNRPEHFPVLTGQGASSWFFCQETMDNEVGTLSALGFNGIGFYGYDPSYYNNGFTNLDINRGYLYMMLNGDLSTPDEAWISQRILADVEEVAEAGHIEDITRWFLGDEPSSMSMEHIAVCDACAAKFRRYLEDLGLTPELFGQSDWELVYPTTDKENEPELFYYTAMFRGRILTDVFKQQNDIISAMLPGTPTTSNFGEDLTFNGNGLRYGIDWFGIFENGALNMGWTEDYLSYSATFQLAGYRADMLRGAAAAGGKPFGMYNIIRSSWDTEAKAVNAIGHGSSRLFHYNYGPFYAASDSFSLKTDIYPAIKEVNYAVGNVEDYLKDAVVPRAAIALIYSHATDVWTLDQEYSAFGKDRMGLYLILKHLGYPVDVISESDIARGALSGYQVAICDGSHFDMDALAPLIDWMQHEGGTLYIGPGSLTRDQFDQPLGFDDAVGIGREDYMFVQSPGREVFEFPVLTNLASVRYGSEILESVSGYQRVRAPGSDAVILATFEDENGAPAVIRKPVGQGALVFSGFFPGLAYQKTAMIGKLARDQANPDFPTYGATDWPASLRSLFSEILGTVPTPVTTGNYLVEANRIESPTATVITIANWTGQPLDDVTISFEKGAADGEPFSVVSPIEHAVDLGGSISVTLDLHGPMEFIVLPR